ncbi:MAG: hypothetical protein WDM96_06650 [Lacunisphaera sp.]
MLMLNVGEIARVNLDNGKAETIDRSPAWASTWVLDSESRARALYRSNFRFGTADFWWRPKPEANGASRSFTATDRRFIPQAIDADGIHLWGWELEAGKETTFSSFDTQSGERTVKHFLPNLPPTHLLMLGKTRQPVRRGLCPRQRRVFIRARSTRPGGSRPVAGRFRRFLSRDRRCAAR